MSYPNLTQPYPFPHPNSKLIPHITPCKMGKNCTPLQSSLSTYRASNCFGLLPKHFTLPATCLRRRSHRRRPTTPPSSSQNHTEASVSYPLSSLSTILTTVVRAFSSLLSLSLPHSSLLDFQFLTIPLPPANNSPPKLTSLRTVVRVVW